MGPVQLREQQSIVRRENQRFNGLQCTGHFEKFGWQVGAAGHDSQRPLTEADCQKRPAALPDEGH